MATITNGNGYQNGIKQDEDFEEIEIPVPWGHISGKWWGSKAIQPILAIHGWQDNAGTFDNLAPLLANRGLALLCIDLPGHGRSSPLPEGQYYYLFWDGVHILRRIVKYFNWKDIMIIGHSLGGGMAFLYAAAYPEETKRYISIDIASPSVRSPKKMVAQIGNSVDKFLKYEDVNIENVPCYGYGEMLEIVQDAYGEGLTRESCKVMMKRGMKPATHKEGYIFTRDPRLKVAALGFMTIDQVLEFASCITCEVMNIRANPGLKFDHPEHYDMVLDKIEMTAKKLERHLVHGTHHLHLNDPESVAEIIYNFLTS